MRRNPRLRGPRPGGRPGGWLTGGAGGASGRSHTSRPPYDASYATTPSPGRRSGRDVGRVLGLRGPAERGRVQGGLRDPEADGLVDRRFAALLDHRVVGFGGLEPVDELAG